jgi:hypothetical protein
MHISAKSQGKTEQSAHPEGKCAGGIIVHQVFGTVLLEILHARAIARLVSPVSSFSLRISRILRNVNLTLVMLASLSFGGKHDTFCD